MNSEIVCYDTVCDINLLIFIWGILSLMSKTVIVTLAEVDLP